MMNLAIPKSGLKPPGWIRLRPRLWRVTQICFFLGLLSVLMATAFWLHFNLSTAASIDLLLVVLVSLRLGFAEATLVSVIAVVTLNYLFTPPIFQFTVADSMNWISLGTFEGAALMVSGLASKVRSSAQQADLQRLRSVKLYELSRAILLIDNQANVSEQLTHLIQELIGIEAVDLWTTDDVRPRPLLLPDDTPVNSGRSAHRALRLGTQPIGAMTMRGWDVDPLLADAVASLAAIALERARAIQREGRTAAERNAEQLRSAVLDGLAHGFKTPLTAIQTASSGLLAIGQLNATQAELVGLIDEQATMLNQLATRLLQTAALEGREVRLRRSSMQMAEVIERVIRSLDADSRSRITLTSADDLLPVELDAALIELAVLQLIDNAAKYSDVGTPIRINVAQTDAGIEVLFENSGKQIPAEEREKIFQRFYRSGDSTRGPTGTGLGLSIVKKIVEAHGGTAEVKSAEGLTRFCLTLPNYRRGRNG